MWRLRPPQQQGDWVMEVALPDLFVAKSMKNKQKKKTISLVRIDAALGAKLLPGTAITGCKVSPAKIVAETIKLMLNCIGQ
jgi:hypothetical protein